MAKNRIPYSLRAVLSAVLIVLTLVSPLSNANILAPGTGLNSIPQDTFDHEGVLRDFDNRISADFKIPESLKKRTAFWFDVYTKYTSNQHVIHHMDYPWIIYDVVDVEPILNGPGHKWTKHHKAEREVRKRRANIQALLQQLNWIKPNQVLKPELQILKDQLEEIPGKRKNVYRAARLSTRIQLGQKDYIENGLINGSKYFPLMEQIFAAHKLPLELTRLPLVESSFNEEAMSKVGASGIWQIMPSMGRILLTMQGPIDERNSPLKATEAAAKLLKQNLKILKTWPLALTAYNHGPGGIKKAAQKARSTDMAVIIQKSRGGNFGFATSNFYCEFLAALHAEKYHKEIFGDLPLNSPLTVKPVALSKPFRVKALVNMLGLSMDDLQYFNPELQEDDIRSHTYLPRGFKLFVPESHSKDFELAMAPKPKAASKKRVRKVTDNGRPSKQISQN